jgi:hypothetical protein
MESFDDIPDTVPAAVTLARMELDSILDTLDRDEIRVLVRIAERLESGSQVYGPLHITLDERCFRSKEAREELEDARVYLACAWLKCEEAAS